MVFMSITVNFFANFREATGVDRIEVKRAEDLDKLLKWLVARFGKDLEKDLYEEGKVCDFVSVLVNGRGVPTDKPNATKLRDGDIVSIFPIISGGLIGGVC